MDLIEKTNVQPKVTIGAGPEIHIRSEEHTIYLRRFQTDPFVRKFIESERRVDLAQLYHGKIALRQQTDNLKHCTRHKHELEKTKQARM